MLGAGSILLLMAILWAWSASGPGPARPVPSWVTDHQELVSQPELLLPRAEFPGTVPFHWRELSLGMTRGEIPASRIAPLEKPLPWGEALYHPDPSRREVFLGLSFHRDRLFRMIHHFGDQSGILARNVLAPSMVMFGKPEGYEYDTATLPHVVTIFRSESRLFKLDFVKTPDGEYLYEITLVDIEEATRHESES